MSLEEETPAPSSPEDTTSPPAEADNGAACVIPEWAIPRVDHLIIEDGKPVDSIYFEKLMRLLTQTLYASWPGPGRGRPFAVFADVGLFPEPKQTPLVPDVMLSLDVTPRDLTRKEHNSYFVWVFGKPPDAVIEFVSDKRGGEATHKMERYADIGVDYYVIYDPKDLLRGGVLRAYTLTHGSYEPTDPDWLPGLSLGLKLWEGAYEDMEDVWLRWCDRDGNVIPTGPERIALETRRVDDAEKRADKARKQAGEAKKQAGEAKKQAGEAKKQADKARKQTGKAEKRADEAEKRAQQLAERLRELGIDPDAP